MSTSRRLLLYTTALIGFLIMLASLMAVSGDAIRLWGPGLALTRAGSTLARESTGWIVLGLAGVVLWALGWFPANRAARRLTLAGAAERASAQRKAYLYTGQFVTVVVGLTAAGWMVADLLRHALDLPAGDLASWSEGALAEAAGALIAFSFWGHLRWVTVHDGDFGREVGRAANWRRAYLYLVALAGFALVIGGAIGYLRAMLGLAAGALRTAFAAGPAVTPAAAAWREPIVWSVTALAIGIPAAILIWSTAGRTAAAAPAREYGALSRVTLLHTGLVFGTAATLLGAIYLLWQGLLLATGGLAGAGLDWPTLNLALACLPVGVVSWLAFASGARHTVALSRAAPPARTAEPGRARAVAIRRFTFYLLAAAALAAFWLGLTQLLQVILSGVVDPAAAARSLAAQPRAGAPSVSARFSLGAALVLVGAPAWWGYWWPCQVRARRYGAPGSGERNSAARKAYLYGIIAAGVIVLALSLLASALQAARGSTSNAAIGVLSGGVIALLWLITHLLVLRGDRRREVIESPGAFLQPAPAPDLAAETSAPGARSYSREELVALAAAGALSPSASAPRPVIVIDGGSGGLGASLLAALHRALPEAPLWPFGLNANAQAAMVAALGNAAPPPAAPPAAPPALPSDALARAIAVVGPSDMLLPGALGGEVSSQLLAGLAASPARLVLLPPRDLRLRWVAAPDWPEARWIENAVIEVANLLQ